MTRAMNKPDKNTLNKYSSALVIGLGVTGFSVVRYLKARGLEVLVIDSRDEPPLAAKLKETFPGIESHFGSFDLKNIGSIGLTVVSPGIDIKHPFLRELKEAGADIVGDIELFVEENIKPVIAITGSNGKSTVTALTGEICSAAGMQSLVAGNIGLPVLDALTDDVEYDIAVLELSSFQLETTHSLRADSATILNLSADHMDRYDSLGDYLLAKAKILRGARNVVLPRHDEQLSQIAHNGKLLSFELDEPANDDEFGISRVSNYRWLVQGKQKQLRLSEVHLTGLHNIKNVLAAFALVDFLNLPNEKILSAIKAFRGLPHRMQTVAKVDKVTWVNDSKATNIGATESALKNTEGKVIWIAGGQGKGADFTQLQNTISDDIKLLILIGEDADKIEAALENLVPIEKVKTMRDAVAKAAKFASPNTIVLLSPACASLDMYENFEQRGDDFASEVDRYVVRGAA